MLHSQPLRGCAVAAHEMPGIIMIAESRPALEMKQQLMHHTRQPPTWQAAQRKCILVSSRSKFMPGVKALSLLPAEQLHEDHNRMSWAEA